jgi:hypothetical protein
MARAIRLKQSEKGVRDGVQLGNTIARAVEADAWSPSAGAAHDGKIVKLRARRHVGALGPHEDLKHVDIIGADDLLVTAETRSGVQDHEAIRADLLGVAGRVDVDHRAAHQITDDLVVAMFMSCDDIGRRPLCVADQAKAVEALSAAAPSMAPGCLRRRRTWPCARTRGIADTGVSRRLRRTADQRVRQRH